MASLTLILAASVGIHAGHGGAGKDCRECGGADAVVQGKIEKLRTSCLWIVRRKAARELRGYDWRRHPEAVEALAEAVAHDRQSLVRQEAAESLGKMRPCLPVAHETLARASERDSSLIARHAARRALKALEKSCDAPCDICEHDSPGFPPAPRFDTDEMIVPPLSETSLEPIAPTPTSMSVPVAPGSPSPFAPEEGVSDWPPPRRVQRPMVHPEDSSPLVPPTAPIDRYDPFPGPPPTPIDIPAPAPGWPR